MNIGKAITYASWAVMLACLIAIWPTSAGQAGYAVGLFAAGIGGGFIVTAIPAGIYWLIKKKPMPGMNPTAYAIGAFLIAISATHR